MPAIAIDQLLVTGMLRMFLISSVALNGGMGCDEVPGYDICYLGTGAAGWSGCGASGVFCEDASDVGICRVSIFFCSGFDGKGSVGLNLVGVKFGSSS